MAVIDMPMEFPGTHEERLANRRTHNWHDVCGDGDYRCWECDCKMWHITAGWPCGADVPRVQATTEDLDSWMDNFRTAAWLNG